FIHCREVSPPRDGPVPAARGFAKAGDLFIMATRITNSETQPMMMMIRLPRLAAGALLLVMFLAKAALAQDQQYAMLGDFKLESGEVIRDCRIGYRTYGKLNADRSNAILFPTWASGTTEQLQSNFGPGRLIDTTKYYAVAVDALGNGVSSSP